MVAKKLNGNYACRSEDLQGKYSECVSILQDRTNRGQPWQIRHVYRQYNAVADALAGKGAIPELLDPSRRRQSGSW